MTTTARLTLALAATLSASVAANADPDRDHDWLVDRGGIPVEVWTDRGREGVYQNGERVSLRFRAEEDAYVVVYGLDVDGRFHLLYPVAPESPRFVQGGVRYEVYAPFLNVGGTEGIVYVEALACRYPLEPHLPRFFYEPIAEASFHGGGVYASAEIGRVTGDPYLALADLRTRIVPYGCASEYVGFASTYYYVHAPHYYPRYVCADCHSGRWYDPYHDRCSVFDVRVDTFWSIGITYHVDHCKPRFYYWKRAHVPVRYKSHKTRWSTQDGHAHLAQYFGGHSKGDQNAWKAGDVRPKSVVAPKPVIRPGDAGKPEGGAVRPGKPSRPDKPVVRPSNDSNDRPGSRPVAKPRSEPPKGKSTPAKTKDRPTVDRPSKKKTNDTADRGEKGSSKREKRVKSGSSEGKSKGDPPKRRGR